MNDVHGWEYCPEHGCPVVEICIDAVPVCLFDWLQEKTAQQQIMDTVPNEVGWSDLVLQNNLLLPVKLIHKKPNDIYVELLMQASDEEFLEILNGWQVLEARMIQLPLDFSLVLSNYEESDVIEIEMDGDMLLEILELEEECKYCP
ncbi:MAG: hypothetical protein JEZ06_11760 [Anaerolineaceae bacterium]|nr:hypothetical protein [Anaerolineaceae bacterium]